MVAKKHEMTPGYISWKHGKRMAAKNPSEMTTLDRIVQQVLDEPPKEQKKAKLASVDTIMGILSEADPPKVPWWRKIYAWFRRDRRRNF